MTITDGLVIAFDFSTLWYSYDLQVVALFDRYQLAVEWNARGKRSQPSRIQLEPGVVHQLLAGSRCSS